MSCIWDKFIPYIRSGALAGEPLEELESGLKLIEQTETFKNYGYPSRSSFSNIKNAKTFRERCSVDMPGLTSSSGCWSWGRSIGM